MTQPLQTFGNKSLSCVDRISPTTNQRPSGVDVNQSNSSPAENSTHNISRRYYSILVVSRSVYALSKKTLAAVWRLQPSDNLFCSLNTIDIQNICHKTIFRSECEVISHKQRPNKGVVLSEWNEGRLTDDFSLSFRSIKRLFFYSLVPFSLDQFKVNIVSTTFKNKHFHGIYY